MQDAERNFVFVAGARALDLTRRKLRETVLDTVAYPLLKGSVPVTLH